jgi:DNA-3-methyladenine glycosylase II
VEAALRRRGKVQLLNSLHSAEETLSRQDVTLARVISSQKTHWPGVPSEDPIWGLARIVMAQQISTHLACRIAREVQTAHPSVTSPPHGDLPDVLSLRGYGLPERRAECCSLILRRSNEIRTEVQGGKTWEQALAGVKGIGPWTMSVFRIMVLREPDVLPLNDVGLERAVRNLYGDSHNVSNLSENWRPYRSVACWYLWRTLGNEQLG